MHRERVCDWIVGQAHDRHLQLQTSSFHWATVRSGVDDCSMIDIASSQCSAAIKTNQDFLIKTEVINQRWKLKFAENQTKVFQGVVQPESKEVQGS